MCGFPPVSAGDEKKNPAYADSMLRDLFINSVQTNVGDSSIQFNLFVSPYRMGEHDAATASSVEDMSMNALIPFQLNRVLMWKYLLKTGKLRAQTKILFSVESKSSEPRKSKREDGAIVDHLARLQQYMAEYTQIDDQITRVENEA